MKKLVISIRNLKLSIKLTLILVFTCLMLLVLELTGRQKVYHTYDEQLYKRTVQVCIAYASQLETEIKKMENASFTVIGDSGIQEKLTEFKENPKYYYSKKREIGESLASFENLLGNSFSVFVYSANENWINAGNNAKNLDEYMERAKAKKGKTSFFEQDNRIGVFREIRQISGLTMEHLGVLFVLSDLNALWKDLNHNYEQIGVKPELFIFEGESCIYSDSDMQEIPMHITQEILMDDVLYVPYFSAALDWSFVVSVPYAEINESIRKSDLAATCSCVCMAVLVCLLSSLWVYHLLSHIKYLSQKFSLFSTGKMPDPKDYPSYEARTDEFGMLHTQFDKMAQEYQKLTQDAYKNMVLLKDAQFQNLQAQIRPHFLFNTLSMIVWTASEHGDMETAKIADALGRLFRSSLRNTKRLMTIREEMKLVRDYLYIQHIRYSERLIVEEEVEEEIMDALLPSLTIQPLVENVIVHVVEKSLDVCVIRLLGRRIGDEIEFIVEDNNGEIDEDILNKLKSGETLAKGNGVGLGNVDSRIKMAFSDHYGISITREKGRKSQVAFRIPYTTGGEEDDKGDAG